MRWTFLNNFLDHIWTRWSKEHQNYRNRILNCQVEVGDLVFIHDNLPHNRWKMEVVANLIPRRDGFVCQCEARTLTTKNRRVTHLNRQVNKLYPLEIQSEFPVTKNNKHPITSSPTSDSTRCFDLRKTFGGSGGIWNFKKSAWKSSLKESWGVTVEDKKDVEMRSIYRRSSREIADDLGGRGQNCCVNY